VETFANLCDPDDPIFGDVKPMVKMDYMQFKGGEKRKSTGIGKNGPPCKVKQKRTKNAPHPNPLKRKHMDDVDDEEKDAKKGHGEEM
jgi:hypothetical protein